MDGLTLTGRKSYKRVYLAGSYIFEIGDLGSGGTYFAGYHEVFNNWKRLFTKDQIDSLIKYISIGTVCVDYGNGKVKPMAYLEADKEPNKDKHLWKSAKAKIQQIIIDREDN